MSYKYGIDFGTTNSSIALRFVGDDEQEHTILADLKPNYPKETLPSVVFANEEGEVLAGVKAIQRYHEYEGKSILIRKIKMDLEERGSNLSYKVGDCTFTGEKLIAAILKELRIQAQKTVEELDIDMSGVVMGVPVAYGDIQKNILRDALVSAGYYNSCQEADRKTTFVSEPIAVAVHYGENLHKNSTVMVFDFGGGTLDIAITKLKEQDVADPKSHEVLAKKRLTLGGEKLTELFFENSFCSSKKYGTQNLCKALKLKEHSNPAKIWEILYQSSEGQELIRKIDECKCELSKRRKTVFSYVGRDGILLDEKIFYQDDFERAIERELDKIYDIIEECVSEADLEDLYEIDNVVLAGGSSQIPCIQNLLCENFGDRRVVVKPEKEDAFASGMKRRKIQESEVLTSIVRGLALIGSREKELIEDVVDNDYGVWDDKYAEFLPIIHHGTKVKDTNFDRLTGDGLSIEVSCINAEAELVEIKIFQRNLNGNEKLGTLAFGKFGKRKYKIYMRVEKQKNILEVNVYDVDGHRWIDNEIPLNQRTYRII